MLKQEKLLQKLILIEQESKEITMKIRQLAKTRCRQEHEIKEIKSAYSRECFIYLIPVILTNFLLSFIIVFPEQIVKFNLFINEFYPFPFELSFTVGVTTMLLCDFITSINLTYIIIMYKNKLSCCNEHKEHDSRNLKHCLNRQLELDHQRHDIKIQLSTLEKEKHQRKQSYINLRNVLLKLTEEKENSMENQKKYIKK